ncbi:unnamed protein product [Owenia fusiformis]|uniref:Dual oxidase maturation factor 1 n=1 Tax=Owenia fusiformis TaxID=6347 RepID=A0A8S4PV46_OWEFU|nr:unnamed protein product [Owenia fusiformis]
MSGWFDYGRSNGGPTLYSPNKTAVTVDVLEAGFIFAVLIVFFSFLLILPGVRGTERVKVAIRITVSLFIGACIMICNFGQEWEVGHIKTHTQYKAGVSDEIEANIGMKIGLRSINITLKGDPVRQEIANITETINYNERFHWSNPWGQGRRGFSQFAGNINQEYRAANFKGLPYPILWIAEYFVFDGEGIRWGRYYRWSGFYSHIMIWLAFPLWIIANILSFMVIRYSSYLLGMTGGCLLIANIVYASVRNPTDLTIPFEDDIMKLAWGWTFWLNLVNGIICCIIAIVMFLMDMLCQDKIAEFFGVDPLQDYEEYYTDGSEGKSGSERKMAKAASSQNGHDTNDEAAIGDATNKRESQLQPHYRRRGFTITSKQVKKSLRRPRAAPRQGEVNNGIGSIEEDEQITSNMLDNSSSVSGDGEGELYENADQFAKHQQQQQRTLDAQSGVYIELSDK